MMKGDKMKLITIIQYDLKNYFHTKKAFLMMLILPILAIIIAVEISTTLFVNHSSIDPITFVIADQEQSFYTNFFIQKIIETPSLQENIEIIQTSEAEGYKLLRENKIGAMVIIPDQFTSNMQESIFDPIIVIGNHKKPLEATIIKEGMESATHLMSAAQSAVFTIVHYGMKEELDPAQVDEAFQKAALSFSLKALARDQIFSQTIKTPWMDLEPAYFYFSSLLILFLSLYGLQGMYTYIYERENKIITRVLSTGLPLWKIILGKWISLTFFLFIHGNIIVWICKTMKLFEISGKIELAVLLLLIASSCISSFILLASILSKNNYIASMIIFSMSLLGVFLGGGIIPYTYMPGFMEKLGKLTLNYWSIQGLIYALFSNQTDKVWHSILIISILLGLSLICLALSVLWKDKKYETI